MCAPINRERFDITRKKNEIPTLCFLMIGVTSNLNFPFRLFLFSSLRVSPEMTLTIPLYCIFHRTIHPSDIHNILLFRTIQWLMFLSFFLLLLLLLKLFCTDSFVSFCFVSFLSRQDMPYLSRLSRRCPVQEDLGAVAVNVEIPRLVGRSHQGLVADATAAGAQQLDGLEWPHPQEFPQQEQSKGQ